MPLPNILEFIGTNITQRKFQEAQEKLLQYLGLEVPTKGELNSLLAYFQNGAFKAYPTLAAANADIANIALNTKVSVLSAADGGDYYKATANATTLTKSSYDPINRLKALLDERVKIKTDDPDYLFCVTDLDSNVLLAVDHLGKVSGDFKISFNDIEDVSLALHNLSIQDGADDALLEIVDSNGNILGKIEPDGTWVVPSIRTDSILADEIQSKLSDLGSSGQNLQDMVTDKGFVAISEQNYLRIDLNFNALPTDSFNKTPVSGFCSISNSSKTFTHVVAKAKLSLQGQGSLSDLKKNFTLDLLNLEEKSLKVKFGSMIAADSFHLKGFYRDPTHMRDQGGYRCWKQLVQKLDYPYCKVNNKVYTPSVNRTENNEFTIDAKYYPHGFPVEVHLNGEFFGLYTLRLKKTRENYALDNSNLNHIFLDSGDTTAFLKEDFDPSDWEIKSPKMTGYVDLGPVPAAFQNTVGTACTRLFQFTSTLSTSYANHADYIVLPHWVLFFIVAELIGDWDHNGNNYNLMTWNNQHWSILPYDLDWTMNWWSGAGEMKTGYILTADIWSTFRSAYDSQIKEMWTSFRKSGDITVEKMVSNYRDVGKYIPRHLYSADKSKWGSYSTYAGINYPDIEQIYNWFQSRITYLDSKFLIV